MSRSSFAYIISSILSLILIVTATILLLSSKGVAAYNNNPSSQSSSAGKITRDSLVGVWKLTGATSRLPHSSSTAEKPKHQENDVLLKLKDDGTFEPATGNKNDSNKKSSSSFLGLGKVLEGRWNYIQGKLVLASNRPDTIQDLRKVRDTILEGKVVLFDNHDASSSTIKTTKNDDDKADATKSTTTSLLSVKDGSIQMGKFVYPPTHRSFFDLPMFFEPTLLGHFALQQVVSERSVSTTTCRNDDDVIMIEKFQRKDFANKYFWLSSYPLPTPPKKEDLLTKSRRARGKLQEQAPSPKTTTTLADIRVLKVHFLHNYTFEITNGVGSALRLRGMWDIVGTERDELWMQITRFGSGRSVSGSTYSEGATLSHDDQKMYKGRIYRGTSSLSNEEDNDESIVVAKEKQKQQQQQQQQQILFSEDRIMMERTTTTEQVHVKGEVYLGKVSTFREALFVMREASNDDERLLLGEDEDEDMSSDTPPYMDDNAFQ